MQVECDSSVARDFLFPVPVWQEGRACIFRQSLNNIVNEVVIYLKSPRIKSVLILTLKIMVFFIIATDFAKCRNRQTSGLSKPILHWQTMSR